MCPFQACNAHSCITQLDLLGNALQIESSVSKQPKLILSVGIPSEKSFLDEYYDIKQISDSADMIDISSYYFHAPYEVSKPEHHSPLYSTDVNSTKTIVSWHIPIVSWHKNNTTFCPEGFYGDICKLSRVQVFCSVTDMFVVINPYGVSEFKGEITVYERQMSPECHLRLNASAPSYVTIAAELKGYGITLNHTDNTICGNANHTDDNTTTTMTRQFVVTYDPNIRSSTDQIVTARCLLKNGVETINVVSDVTTIEDVNNGYKPVDKNASTNDVTLVVQNSDYSVLSSQSSVQLGDLIYIVIKDSPFEDMNQPSLAQALSQIAELENFDPVIEEFKNLRTTVE
ncbi:hypothetical protein Btru_028700 [Bulinus truncatus]|nr:hypothetical protein Btru_028700 [Bulinus truncatus]